MVEKGEKNIGGSVEEVSPTIRYPSFFYPHRLLRKVPNRYTIVPAPLGVGPNTIEYQPHQLPSRSCRAACKYCAELLFCTQRLALRVRSSLANVPLLFILGRYSCSISLHVILAGLRITDFSFFIGQGHERAGPPVPWLEATAMPGPS